jgi:hypothetical protein
MVGEDMGSQMIDVARYVVWEVETGKVVDVMMSTDTCRIRQHGEMCGGCTFCLIDQICMQEKEVFRCEMLPIVGDFSESMSGFCEKRGLWY